MNEQAIKDYIYDEILVDCKNEYEQNMSWFYYMQGDVAFPFKAEVTLQKTDGTTKIRLVKALDLSADSTNFERGFDLKVKVELDDYIIDMPLSKLENVEGSENAERFAEAWRWWVK